MRLGSAKAWAKTLGAGLATVQNGFDKLVEFGFEKLQNVDTTPPTKEVIRNRYMRSVAKFGVGTISFIGQLGKSYYDSYEELKKKQS